MFDKILIANRGEIACRIMRTARHMGIATLAVHSEADSDALHVRMADEAQLIGPAPPSQSYLRIDAIVNAAQARGADAVHPGYGFLSENADFADALQTAGIAFIGPRRRAIAAMGDKIESKKIAADAGVNTVPGYADALGSAKQAVAVAKDIGYPVMLKASAGGGGKGMRIAFSDDDVRKGFSAAAREAQTSFGDDRLLIEKFVVEPRHIEVQVLGDSHGNLIHLGERECSIQRRHQKIIEEAPSPFIDDSTRETMGAQAVALARAVDYQSAGTVEFIVDANRQFYFLEMNTRLQVEHPVTECVTGVDLVELMIRIAAGEPLPWRQDDVELRGWALEARVYAEDPGRNFVPSTGRLTRYREPVEDDHTRVDSGVFEGSEISIYYDPMMAKLIASGASRGLAIERMRNALDAYSVRGVAHNISFLAAVVGHPRFGEGRISTSFIEQQYPNGFHCEDIPLIDVGMLTALAALLQHTMDERNAKIGGWSREHNTPHRHYVTIQDDQERAVAIVYNGAAVRVEIEGDSYAIEGEWKPGQVLFQGKINGESVSVQVDRIGVIWRLTRRGHSMSIGVFVPRVAELRRFMPVKQALDLSKFLLAPMPGLLVRVTVADGDVVKIGQELAVVEAMKMENALHAEQDGKVAAVLVASGDTLEVDQPIIEFE